MVDTDAEVLLSLKIGEDVVCLQLCTTSGHQIRNGHSNNIMRRPDIKGVLVAFTGTLLLKCSR